MQILDLSKTFMYDFYYNHLIKQYGYENIKLCVTDTDSLKFQVKCNDFYRDMCKPENKDYFDFSEYSKDHPI